MKVVVTKPSDQWRRFVDVTSNAAPSVDVAQTEPHGGVDCAQPSRTRRRRNCRRQPEQNAVDQPSVDVADVPTVTSEEVAPTEPQDGVACAQPARKRRRRNCRRQPASAGASSPAEEVAAEQNAVDQPSVDVADVPTVTSEDT